MQYTGGLWPGGIFSGFIHILAPVTTGAGDAFNAGFAAALTEGQNIKDALKFASATAGLSTTKIGTANSMPSREEIDKLL